MNSEIRALEPSAIWNNFADLNEVPRGSKKEERIIQFMLDFGDNLGLETIKDEVGNVIIRKSATAGFENKKAIVMQSHLDMVHQKNADTEFDFNTQGINMYIDGDWVKARGTTLGADNGLGVATIMAVLESNTIEHPALEALFTIDEETGMTGALGLKGNLLKGDILLNLDTEEDNEIGVGCAGGIDITATRNYEEEQVLDNSIAYRIKVKGLKGGHSGMDIHKGLGNANKIMNRLLYFGNECFGIQLCEIDGGGLRNAIPRESSAIIAIENKNSEGFLTELRQVIAQIKTEYKTVDPALQVEIFQTDLPTNRMKPETQLQLLNAIYAVCNGVYRMSPDIPDLVETSNNLARVLIKDGEIKVLCLTRSSVESSKMDLAHAIRSAFRLGDCDVEFSGSYPGWTPNMDSAILKIMRDVYVELNGDEPNVAACHAGLECGILGANYPSMEMVSFGPNIKGAHSPDERAQISSVQKYWNFVLEILRNIPKK
jgi:dipeptidase D